MTKNEKRSKTKIRFFFLEKKIPLRFFFSDFIEGLNFLKNILVLSGSGRLFLKRSQTWLIFEVFFRPQSHIDKSKIM